MKQSTDRRRGAKLGQHLLTNRGVAFSVAEAAGILSGDSVYEIGPGKGMLTRELLNFGARVVAVEKDPAMVAVLEETFAQEIKKGRLRIITGDAREWTPDKVFPKETYVVAANIPYYITGELVRTALTSKNQPRAVSLLVQKEVAERIARSKKESILSLSVKAYGFPTYVKTVSRGSFNPPPNVESAILLIENISRKNFKDVSEEIFFKTVKAGFAQKRKTLAGNLRKAFGTKSENVLETTELLQKIRAEDVPLQQWLTLAQKII